MWEFYMRIDCLSLAAPTRMYAYRMSVKKKENTPVDNEFELIFI